MIIGLTGEAGAGKDQAAATLVQDHGFTRLAFADLLREALATIDPYVISTSGRPIKYRGAVACFGAEYVKRELGGRRLLENVGDAIKHLAGEGVFVDRLARIMAASPGDYVISDVRFGNEAAMIRANGGEVVCVYRPDNPMATSSTHRSAKQAITADHVLMNPAGVSPSGRDAIAFDRHIVTLVHRLNAGTH
jgi:hypothetical protein